MEEDVRSFVAIELPEKLKEELTQLQAQLKSATGASVKWVAPQGIHITLQFLGGVPANNFDAITQGIEKAAASIQPFRMEVKELGVFPNLRRVRVIWVGLTGELKPLQELQKRIETNLSPLGFKPEEREFTPHLTLGRVRENATTQERERLGQLIAGFKFAAVTPIAANSVSLMRSHLTREGAIYSRLSVISFK